MSDRLTSEQTLLGPSRLLIISNGSKWGGEDPDPIGALLERLETHALDPSFEEYGDFASIAHGAFHHRGYNDAGEWVDYWEDTGPIYADAPYAVSFFGNFHDLSAVFSIVTDDPDIVEVLLEAIARNKCSAAYIEARAADLKRRRVNAPSGTTTEPGAIEPQGSAGGSPAPSQMEIAL